MDLRKEITTLSDIDDAEVGLSRVKEIARQIVGQDIILEVQETLKDEDGMHHDSDCIVVDFAKIEALAPSWRYIARILEQVLLGLHDGQAEIHFEASHKYSFLDTLFREERIAVYTERTEARPYIYAYGDLCY